MPGVRILGIDPGLRHTGWGVIEAEGSRLAFVASGAVHTESGQTLAERLRALHEGLAAVIAAHSPDEAAVEETFVNRDPQSALKLGHARGIALVVPALAWLDWRSMNMPPIWSRKPSSARDMPKRPRSP